MELRFDKAIYSKEVLLKTAYCFTEHVYLHLSQDSTYWIVEYTEKTPEKPEMPSFENELIGQQLREMLLHQTADVRKILLARAFASTVIENPNDEEKPGYRPEDDDPEADTLSDKPLDNNIILKGWFDQNDHI